MSQTLESLDRAVRFGLENGKTNMIVDLAPLALLFEQRDELLTACKEIVRLGKSRYHDLGIDRMVEAAIAKAEGK